MARYYQKNRFIQEQQRIAVWDRQLWEIACKSGKAKEKLFYRGEGKVGRGYYNSQKVHWRKLGV